MNSKSIKAGLAALALLAAPLAAEAADMPVKASPYFKGSPRSVVSYYNWTGFYAGGFGGYGWGKSDWSAPVASTDPKGAIFGLTGGYNWQMGSMVLGIEADYGWSSIKGSAACGAGTCETANSFLVTGRARVGYAFDRWLPYVTGGLAYGDIKATNSAAGTASKEKLGWVAGAGLEYAFLGNWSAKIEYLYTDLGSFDCGTACSAVTPANVDLQASVVRAGLNYKFSGPVFSRF